MRTDFVLDALEQALYDRQPERTDALIHHSDRGSQLGFKESSQHQSVKPQILVHSAPRLVFSSLASCVVCH